MARIAAWEFGDGDAFDGERLYAEVTPEFGQAIRSGTLEVSFTPVRAHRGTLLAHGIPGRDPGAFTVVLTHTGAVAFTATDKAGTPFRVRSPDGLAVPGQRIQVTLSAGVGGQFAVVNCDERDRAPDDPAAGFVVPLPLRTRCDLRGRHGFTFGAAAGGTAPYFAGVIHRATLSDSVDAPTVPLPVARVHRLEAPAAAPVRPRRIRLPAGTVTGAPRSLVRLARLGEMRIATAEGDLPISRVEPGVEVLTRSHGLRPVQWVGHASFDAMALRRRPEARPVVVAKGTLGPGLPEADLVLAPYQRLMVPGAALAERGPAEDGFLPGGHLGSRAGKVEPMGITYLHFHCDRTESVQINGLWVEALNPHDTLLNPVQAELRDRLLALFPALRRDDGSARR